MTKSHRFPDLRNERTSLAGEAPRLAGVLAALGVAGLAAGAALGAAAGDSLRTFYHAWLVNACFFLSLSLGALFFVAILHATRSGWGVAVRRIAEVAAANFAVLAALFLPVLFGISALYEWANPAAVAGDHILEHKAPYLNVGFFAARAAGYFAVWWLLSRFFLRRSAEQDASGDPELTLRMERWSGPSLLLLALTVTFAAFDFLMSLEARWASTIYGVYYFSGAMVGALAVVILAAMALQAAGRLRNVVNVEHYHDLGKLLFAFVVFWGYIAFSQYLLIWYANIPEETVWYRVRLAGGWEWVAVGLLFGHLFIPFLAMMPRAVKRRKPLLAFWAAWLLAMHWFDVVWLVMPRLDPIEHSQPFAMLPMGPLAWAVLASLAVGLGALWLAGAVWTAGRQALAPMKDPRLAESLAFENV